MIQSKLQRFLPRRTRQATTERKQMKTLYELEQESTDGFRNPENNSNDNFELISSMKTLDELEAESTDGFRNPENN